MWQEHTLQGVKQFNGKFGRGFCLHAGVVVPKGNRTVRAYPLSMPIPVNRTREKIIHDASKLMILMKQSTKSKSLYHYYHCWINLTLLMVFHQTIYMHCHPELSWGFTTLTVRDTEVANMTRTLFASSDWFRFECQCNIYQRVDTNSTP